MCFYEGMSPLLTSIQSVYTLLELFYNLPHL